MNNLTVHLDHEAIMALHLLLKEEQQLNPVLFRLAREVENYLYQHLSLTELETMGCDKGDE